MLKVTAIPFGLPLKHPFHIAHGSSEYRENVFLQIIHDDKTAYGEAAVVPYYGVRLSSLIFPNLGLRRHIVVLPIRLPISLICRGCWNPSKRAGSRPLS
jgi:L-alanine-DL-glutamate epimerase-like enolase superfamily enzyme